MELNYSPPPPISVFALIVMWGIALSTKQPQLLVFVGMSAFALVAITVIGKKSYHTQTISESFQDSSSTESDSNAKKSFDSSSDYDSNTSYKNVNTGYHSQMNELLRASESLRSTSESLKLLRSKNEQLRFKNEQLRASHSEQLRASQSTSSKSSDSPVSADSDDSADSAEPHNILEPHDSPESPQTNVEQVRATSRYRSPKSSVQNIEGFEPQFAPANIESVPLNRSNNALKDADMIRLDRSMDLSSGLIDRNEYQPYKPQKFEPNPFTPPPQQSGFKGLDSHDSSYVTIDLSSFALQDSCQKSCVSACQKHFDDKDTNKGR